MSFNEKRSYTEYNVTTSTSVFAIGFDDYNMASKDRIIVTIDGVEATEAGYTVTRSSPSTLTLNPAVASGVVRLTRETNIDQTFNKFTAGSLFTPKNVNDNFEQILRSQQEVEDRQTKLEGDVLPLVDGLEDALAAAETASQAAEEAANAATDAAASAEFFGSNYGKGIRPLWKDELKPYAQWAEVRLDSGGIVRSIIPNNTNNPNNDMSGWVPDNKVSVDSLSDLYNITPYNDQLVFVRTRDNVSNSWFSGYFQFVVDSTETVDNGIVFNAPGGRWIRVLSGTINPLMFGNKSTSDQIIINKAIIACKRFKQKLDLSVSGWDIDGEIKFYEYDRIYVISSQDSIINCLASGTYTNGYCVEFGKANFDPSTFRMVGAVIDGNLWIRTDRQETTVLHGAYVKGSWLNIDYVRGEGFNGTGVNADSVFDSNIRHLSSELCGNMNDYAMVISSQLDTTNCTTFGNLQIEQAQYKILQINAIRTTILNIHQERATIADDTNVNIDILLTNSTIEQAVFDSLANVIDVKLNLDQSTVSNIYAAHARVKSDYGTHGTVNTLTAIRYEQFAPARKVTLNSPVILDYIGVEGGCNVHGGTVKDVKNSFNCRDLNFYGTAIENVNLSQNILGNITFNECPIKNVYETKSPSSNYKKTTFNDCNIENFVGAFNGQARVNGGFIKTVNLTSQALVDFIDVEGVTFAASGNLGYLTRNCNFSGSVSWSLPTMSKPAGLLTERIGYDAAGKIYQNTASGVNWVKLA